LWVRDLWVRIVIVGLWEGRGERRVHDFEFGMMYILYENTGHKLSMPLMIVTTSSSTPSSTEYSRVK
jgi:hypothetical protein